MDIDDADEAKRPAPQILFGRFMSPDKTEHGCSVVGFTIEGAELRGAETPPFGALIVAYLEHFGRIEGRATAATEDGFRVEWLLSAHRRDRLLEKCEWFDRHRVGQVDNERQYNRRQLHDAHTTVTLLDGRKFPCTVIDVSLTGAALTMEEVPDIGSRIYLGNILCEVVRHSSDGLGVRFLVGFGSDVMASIFGDRPD